MWLEQNKIEFAYRDLLKDPLSAEELQQLAVVQGLAIHELVNLKSQVYKKMNINVAILPDHEVLAAIMENPRILKRPVISDGHELLFGFKEEDYLQQLRTK